MSHLPFLCPDRDRQAPGAGLPPVPEELSTRRRSPRSALYEGVLTDVLLRPVHPSALPVPFFGNLVRSPQSWTMEVTALPTDAEAFIKNIL